MVGVPHEITASQAIVAGARHVMVGGVLSCTTIVRLHVELLPQSSVDVQVRVTEYA